MLHNFVDDHETRHAHSREWAIALIGAHRDCLGIEPKWAIQVHLLCTEEQPEESLPQACVEWIPDTYEAQLSLRCDLPYGLLRWETIHELVELSLYRSGTVCDQVFQLIGQYGSEDLAALFMSQYRVARNQEVEAIVQRYLGECRPVISSPFQQVWDRRPHRRLALPMPPGNICCKESHAQ